MSTENRAAIKKSPIKPGSGLPSVAWGVRKGGFMDWQLLEVMLPVNVS